MPERLRRIAAHIVGLCENRSKEEQFVVNCIDCRRNVPIGLLEFPFHSISIECPLCGATHRYRPSEISYGIPDELVRQPQRPSLWRPGQIGIRRC